MQGGGVGCGHGCPPVLIEGGIRISSGYGQGTGLDTDLGYIGQDTDSVSIIAIIQLQILSGDIVSTLSGYFQDIVSTLSEYFGIFSGYCQDIVRTLSG